MPLIYPNNLDLLCRFLPPVPPLSCSSSSSSLLTNTTEDTTGIIIPSVFVSRASYLTLRDLLVNHTVKGEPGLRVEIGEASDDGR